jgi:hypothetical protein
MDYYDEAFFSNIELSLISERSISTVNLAEEQWRPELKSIANPIP